MDLRETVLALFCDPEGEPCFHGSDGDRAVLKAVLSDTRKADCHKHGVNVSCEDGIINIMIPEHTLMIVVGEDGEPEYSRKQKGYYANSSKPIQAKADCHEELVKAIESAIGSLQYIAVQARLAHYGFHDVAEANSLKALTVLRAARARATNQRESGEKK